MRICRITFLAIWPALVYAVDLDWITALGGRFERDSSGQVTEVHVRASWISDGDLADMAALPSLRRLDLSRTRITDRGVMYLKQARNLQDVNLAFAEHVGDPIHAVVREWKGLRRLNLRGTRVGDATAAAAAALPELESLDISLSDVQDFGLDAISAAPKLKELTMGGARIGEPAFQFLRQLTSLESLDVGAPTQAITFRGGMNLSERALEAIASLERLRELRLSFNRFPGRHLASLKTLMKLERLDLQSCPGVTDEAIPHLAGLKNLRWVDLHGTAITKEAVANLRNLRPDVQVLWE